MKFGGRDLLQKLDLTQLWEVLGGEGPEGGQGLEVSEQEESLTSLPEAWVRVEN